MVTLPIPYNRNTNPYSKRTSPYSALSSKIFFLLIDEEHRLMIDDTHFLAIEVSNIAPPYSKREYTFA